LSRRENKLVIKTSILVELLNIQMLLFKVIIKAQQLESDPKPPNSIYSTFKSRRANLKTKKLESLLNWKIEYKKEKRRNIKF
jgi:hypothetical protein